MLIYFTALSFDCNACDQFIQNHYSAEVCRRGALVLSQTDRQYDSIFIHI